MNLTRTHDAESEVLALQDVKNHLRITTTADDESFRDFIAAIRHVVENFLCKTLITSIWEAKMDCFPSEIRLPMGPIQSITTIAYIDTDGDSQTFTDFQFDRFGRVRPAFGFTWPSTRLQFDAVTVTYVAGETHAGNVDPDIKHAMKLLVGAADVGREDTVIGAGVVVSTLPNGAADLLTPHRNIQF